MKLCRIALLIVISDVTNSFLINSAVLKKNERKIVFASSDDAIKDRSSFLASSLVSEDGGGVVSEQSIRAQIEDMKKEAITRLEDLSKQIENDLIISSEESALCSKTISDDRRHPMEDTSWKITLNVGRENGTWMPKEWGISGDRLLIKLAVKFTYDDLTNREEFLGTMSSESSDCKILEVIDNEVTIGPTIQDGMKHIIAKHGGWRILPKEGPAGTDLMRFYIEIEERAQHSGSDVFCPKGRVYCTCGYFPDNTGKSSGRIEMIQDEKKVLRNKYEHLKNIEATDQNFFSLKKISRSRKIVNLLAENKKLNEHLKIARIQEPGKDQLRFSDVDGSTTALTHEGGLCIKVAKGLSTEYHILGRFSIGSLASKNGNSNNNKAKNNLRP